MILEFLHHAGIIVGLGAVTVIDTAGLIARKSVTWTQTTIEVHHITKPLIWLGTLMMTFTWFFLYDGTRTDILKSVLIVVLLLNGSFLSFYVSPRLDKLSGKNKILPPQLQRKIGVSVIISFLSWWSLVWITVSP